MWVLCGLAIYATKWALRESETENCEESVRAHRLAVLYIIMFPLARYGFPGWRRKDRLVLSGYIKDNERAYDNRLHILHCIALGPTGR